MRHDDDQGWNTCITQMSMRMGSSGQERSPTERT